MADKKADLAGPGISTYEEVAKVLPRDYESLLTPKETMKALYGVKAYIEENLNRELNLMMVQVPLIVDRNSGVNDMLDRDGSRTPIEFDCGLGLETPIRASVVQARTRSAHSAASGSVMIPTTPGLTRPSPLSNRARTSCKPLAGSTTGETKSIVPSMCTESAPASTCATSS